MVQRFLQPSGLRCSHVDNGMDNEKGGRILNEDVAVAYYDQMLLLKSDSLIY